MDEHISKPVDPRRLVETVRTLVGAAEPAALPGIDMVDAMIRLGDNYDLLKMVYIDFRGQYGDGATEMAQLIAARIADSRR